MQYLKRIFLLLGLLLMPLLALSQHKMTMDDAGLDAAKTYHAESLYHMNAEWANQNGETIQLADYLGQPLVLVMFYGRCTGTCPVLIQRTWKLYSGIDVDIRDRVQVLAVSFDYKNDTPQALKEYAENEQLDIPGWNFVTAQQSDIRELAMLLGVQYRERSDGHFEHSNLITVLDAQGKIVLRSEGIKGGLSDTATAIEELFKSDLQ
jgi:protein SCO1/2